MIAAAGSNQTPYIDSAGLIFSYESSTGNLSLPSNIGKATANSVSNIGTLANWWNTVFAQTLYTGNLSTGASGTAGVITGTWTLSSGSKFNATYADLAEKYVSDYSYDPGTVLIFGGQYEVTIANKDMDTAVAGIVSSEPAFILNSNLEAVIVVDLALVGRVPTKVVGPVKKGDLMVSANNGIARAEANPKVGSVIGKSLEDYYGESVGLIEIVLGRN
jgi:hypothetical protein